MITIILVGSEKKTEMTELDKNRLVLSHLELRKIVGILGTSFAFILAFGYIVQCGCVDILDSVSDYYTSIMRNVFVGYLFVIGLFLFAYKGYNKTDDLVGNLACVFAISVAIFPNKGFGPYIQAVHFSSAGLLFGALSYFSLVLFKKSNKSVIENRKATRNKVYTVCGIVMLSCVILLIIYYAFFKNPSLDQYSPVYWLETLALIAFGVSWLTKGEMMLRDMNR